MNNRTLRARLLRPILWVLISVLLLALGYIAFNTPFSSSVRVLSKDELRAYTNYLNTHISDPQEFVADKFDTHDVVLLGEMHWKKQDVEFVRRLIPFLYHAKGVTAFAWEFGASEFQSEADALVNSPEFSRDNAIAFMRKSNFSWNFEEYLNIIQTIWEVNHSVPEGQPKIRFLQLGSEHNPRRMESPDPAIRRQARLNAAYDEKMGSIIETEVLRKHAKALWYSGLHHAFTHYTQPLFLFLKPHDIRGGTYLFQRYPDKIYLIQLSQPFYDRLLTLHIFLPSVFGTHMNYVPPFRGTFEQIYRAYKKPFAVDASHSFFGDLVDKHSYYSLDRWGGVSLREMSDGYIVLCGIDEMQPVGLVPDWVTTSADLEEVKNVLPPATAAGITDIEALLNYLKADNPQRSQFKDIARLFAQ
jgi:hypothetical protein